MHKYTAWFITLALTTGLTDLQKAAEAGTTGKIAGQITDAWGHPLPGASVVIEGTRRGAETDEEGIFFILSVAPGRYTLVASMIGYRRQKKEQALVTSDFTTNVSFELEEASLQLGEIVVVADAETGGGWGMVSGKAQAPPVEPDKTMTKHIIRAEDIEILPSIRDVESFVALQGGTAVSAGGDEIYVRAARTSKMGYYVDGIQLPIRDHVYPKVYQDVNHLAVQEMVLITGGVDAEYGNAQAGVVSVVTREGGQRYEGMVDYQVIPPGQKHWGANVYESPIHEGRVHWDDPAWVSETVTLPDGVEALAHPRRNYTGVWGHFLEGSLSGPLSSRSSFFASGQWKRKSTSLPAPYLTSPFNLNVLSKITYQPNRNMKLSGGGFFDRRRGANDGRVPREATTDTEVGSSGRTPLLGALLDIRDNGRSLFVHRANSLGDHWDTDVMGWAGLMHILSENTFWEIRLARSVSRRDTVDVPYPPGVMRLSDVRPGLPLYDAAGVFVVHHDAMSWDRFSRDRMILKSDLSSQVNRRHFLKTGLEVIRYNNWAHSVFADGSTRNIELQWYSKAPGDNGFFPDSAIKGMTPWQVGAYLQDKIELDGMIVNAGVRYDALIQNQMVEGKLYFASPMWNGLTRNRSAPRAKGPAIDAWSPRLGVTHPMGERSVIRFFYGRTHQLPVFDDLYTNFYALDYALGADDRDLNDNGVIDPAEQWNAFTGPELRGIYSGNPGLPTEMTTAFEVGCDWSFRNDYVLGLTTYYRRADREIAPIFGFWQGPQLRGNPSVILTRAAGVARDARGFEVTLKKRFSHLFAFNFTLNIQWSDLIEGTHANNSNFNSFPDSLFVANGHYWTQYDVDPVTGAEIPVSLKEQAKREGKDEDFYIRKFGAAANQMIRFVHTAISAPNRSAHIWVFGDGHYAAEGVELIAGQPDDSFYSDEDRRYWERLNNRENYPGTGEGNILLTQKLSLGAPTSSNFDRRSFGSLTALFATPDGFGPLNGKLLSNLRANLVYRIYTGTPFQYSPLVAISTSPGQFTGDEPAIRYGPLHTRTDLAVEKSFGGRDGLLVALGLEVFNLFNQKDSRSTSPDPSSSIDFDGDKWQQWGISGLDPVEVRNRGVSEVHDVLNYWDTPRELTFSVQVKW